MIHLESDYFHYGRKYPQTIEKNIPINSSNPSGLTIKKFHVPPTEDTKVFYMDITTDSDYFPLQN